MNQQKMVITDWGGVIEQHSEEAYFSYSELYHVLKQFGGDDIPKNYHEIINEALQANDKHPDDIARTTNIKPYLDKMFELFKIETYPEIYIDFLDTYTQITSDVPYDRELARYLAGLKGKCKLGILSNLTVFDGARQNRQLDWDNYDYRWLSYETGLIKPDPQVYRMVENQSGLQGSQILFIEDVDVNLHVPREQFGWNTYVAKYKNTKATIEAIEKFLQE